MSDAVKYGGDETGPPAIVARDLVRRFGTFTAVDGIDLEVGRGEIYGFLGPNGAGKSTVVRMLCTLLQPTGGSAEVAGFDVERDTEQVRLRIGVALQDVALDPHQSGRELLRLQARLYGLRSREIATRLSDVLDLVDIGDAIDRRVASYSGGMKRRLDLAMALIHDPEVLFLDEPTTGLDPFSREAVWREVQHLSKELGMTIFLTTQYLEEADELAHRVGIVARGRVVAEGTPGSLKRAVGRDRIVVEVDGSSERAAGAISAVPGVEDVAWDEGQLTAFARDGAGALSPIALALDAQDLHVLSLTLRTPTLDDVFRQMTGTPLEQEPVPSGVG
jgi:ABC-2 type transport system ATP-binding protein